jgi:hypothetical protein
MGCYTADIIGWNFYFYVAENTYIHVDELNDILSTDGHKKVNEIKEIDQLQLKKEEDDGHDDDENKDEEDLN